MIRTGKPLGGRVHLQYPGGRVRILIYVYIIYNIISYNGRSARQPRPSTTPRRPHQCPTASSRSALPPLAFTRYTYMHSRHLDVLDETSGCSVYIYIYAFETSGCSILHSRYVDVLDTWISRISSPDLHDVPARYHRTGSMSGMDTCSGV
jgi:hypothetical protein